MSYIDFSGLEKKMRKVRRRRRASELIACPFCGEALKTYYLPDILFCPYCKPTPYFYYDIEREVLVKMVRRPRIL